MLRYAVPQALGERRGRPGQVIGIGTDYTAVPTVLPTTVAGNPLCELEDLQDRPPRLSQAVEAPRGPAPGRTGSQRLAAGLGEDWLPRYGGKISSEWEFAKALQVLEEDPEVYERARRSESRPPTGSSGSCAAGRPKTSHRRIQGHPPGRKRPSPEYLAKLNPGFADFQRSWSTRCGPWARSRAG